MGNPRHFLRVEALNSESFLAFGHVIDAESATQRFVINGGYATRLHALAQVDVADLGGLPIISIFQASPRPLPLLLHCMERHPLGSQAFIPLHTLPYLVVVAPGGPLDLTKLRCFLAKPGQGVNYYKGVWHHPLIALEQPCSFLVVDRAGSGHSNLDEVEVAVQGIWVDTVLEQATP